MSASSTVRLTDVFLTVSGQQWSTMAQRKQMYQAVFVSEVSLLLVLSFDVIC